MQQGMNALPALEGGGAHPAIAAHALKALGQDVLKKTAQELSASQSTDFVAAGDAVAILKGDGALVAGQQSRGAQRGLVDIGRQIAQGGLAAAGGLDVHDPVDAPDLGWDLAEEFGMAGAQVFLEPVAEAGGQHGLRQEEVRLFDTQPAQAIGGESAAGNQVMDVRMMFDLSNV
jgi:hypothetical protein